jgi:ABC-2 type transport system ATP-binding protein
MSDVINLEGVFKSLGTRQILNNVTLSVQQGDIFGYLGPNGAGKTTTIRIILGLMQPTQGKARMLGEDVSIDKVREKIGFVLETDGLYDNISALDNLNYYGQFYKVDKLGERIDRAIRLVGLQDRTGDKVSAYSKGMRQRLALARAMVHDPQVLILDEPTSGVDPSGQIEIRQIMLDMVHKEGKTILLSSHNLDEVQRICNSIALIHKGEIKLYGELEKLQHQMSRGEVTIETAEPVSGEIVAEINKLPNISVREQNKNLLTLGTGNGGDASSAIALLAIKGVKIEQVKKQEASLEEMYTTILKEAEHK